MNAKKELLKALYKANAEAICAQKQSVRRLFMEMNIRRIAKHSTFELGTHLLREIRFFHLLILSIPMTLEARNYSEQSG